MRFIEGVTIYCIGASYAVALGVEILHFFRPRGIHRLVGLFFGAAGFLAHTVLLGRMLFLIEPPLSLESPFGSLLFLAWILAVFYLYGTLHHRRLAWGLFILPLVLGLVILARLYGPQTKLPGSMSIWGMVHGALLLLAAVGVSVGFFASLMYLVQARRLQTRALPGKGLRLPSLERLEEMNRRAIVLAFPLLTAGMLVGIGLMVHQGNRFADWGHWKIISTVILWVVFALLLYLRYAVRIRGRRVALLTLVAFALLLFTLVSTHQFVAEGIGP